MKKIFLNLCLLQILFTAHAQTPDLILINGKIFTSDTAQLYVEALAIKAGRITATGSTKDIEKLALKSTKTLDLGGKLVVPGFNDAHNRLPDGFKATKIAFTSMDPSWQTMLDSLQRSRIKRPPGSGLKPALVPALPILLQQPDLC